MIFVEKPLIVHPRRRGIQCGAISVVRLAVAALLYWLRPRVTLGACREFLMSGLSAAG